MSVCRYSFATAKSVLVGLSLCLLSQNLASAQHMQPTPVLNDYFKMVFSGDISGASNLFQSHPEDHAANMLKSKFDGRFVDNIDGLNSSDLKSEKVQDILALFEDYWRRALMQVGERAEVEIELKTKLDQILTHQGYESAVDDEDQLVENLETFIHSEGVFALGGRTPPLLELMIWQENKVSIRTVELTDGVFEVRLNQLDDFISYGWSNFATFGMASTGGWAKKDGLYCVCSQYDLNSEKFKLSFLKHETRHFVDFGLYPNLQASDMEYRGKLTELAYAGKEVYSQLAHFTTNANKVANAPHPLANWYIIDELSALLLNGVTASDPQVWKTVAKKDIRAAAIPLLQLHDAVLKKAGPETTLGVITP